METKESLEYLTSPPAEEVEQDFADPNKSKLKLILSELKLKKSLVSFLFFRVSMGIFY